MHTIKVEMSMIGRSRPWNHSPPGITSEKLDQLVQKYPVISGHIQAVRDFIVEKSC